MTRSGTVGIFFPRIGFSPGRPGDPPPLDSYAPGSSPKSFDKQYVRDYLETLDWNKQSPGPHLPEVIVARTREKYLEALERLTG